MKKIILIAVLFVVVGTTTRAQLNFIFLPELYGRSVDGLGNFQVQNLGTEKVIGKVFISVKENTSGTTLVTVMTQPVTLNPGATNFPRSVYNSSAFRFSSDAYGAIAGQTRSIPPGEYTFCFKFVPLDKTLYDEYENCFDGSIQPLVPITLLNPALGDTICDKRPLLNWQPPMPFSAAMRFRLLLTEKTTNKPAEDMLMKSPLLLLDNISSVMVNYPSVNPELKEGSTYYWQVIAYEKGLIVSRSEIWEFTVKCKEDVKPGINDSYRELKLLVNGNYYIANRTLRFSFKNDYNIKKLQYAILDLSDGSKQLKNIPEVQLQRGLNKIEIGLEELNLKPGNHYLLRVYPFNEPSIDVRFVYDDRDIE